MTGERESWVSLYSRHMQQLYLQAFIDQGKQQLSWHISAGSANV